MPMLFFFVPFYAIPAFGMPALFFLQIVGATSARSRFTESSPRTVLETRQAGLGFGIAYLLYPVLLHGRAQ